MLATILFLHILGAILWLGPSLGAWIIYLHAKRQVGELRVFEWFEIVLILEHIGLVLLIGSGAYLFLNSGYLELPRWLEWKFYLIVFLILPFEILDIYFAHLWFRAAKKNGNHQAAISAHEKLFRWASLPAFLAAIAILYLAVVKPVY